VVDALFSTLLEFLTMSRLLTSTNRLVFRLFRELSEFLARPLLITLVSRDQLLLKDSSRREMRDTVMMLKPMSSLT
jgi:hypothetical protein